MNTGRKPDGSGNSPPSVRFCLLLVPLFFLLSPPSAADDGRLRDFREGLRIPSEKDTSSDSATNRKITAGEEAVTKTIYALMGGLFVSGTSNSMADRAPEPSPDAPFAVPPRKPGDAVLPYVAGEFQYQWIDGNTDALDMRLAGGYGPAGASVRWTRYRETEPDTHLDVLQAYAHLRLTLGDILEFSPGLGYGNFAFENDADDEGGFALTLPFRIHFHPGIGLEYRPSWVFPNETTVNDQDLALILGRRHAFLRLGYRWLWNDAETLSGPYAGVSLRW